MRALFSYAILIKEKLFLKKVQTSHSYPPTYIVLMNDESSHGLKCKIFLQNVQLQFLCGKFLTQYFEIGKPLVNGHSVQKIYMLYGLSWLHSPQLFSATTDLDFLQDIF